VFIVAEFITLLKFADSTWFKATFVAPFTGIVETTVGIELPGG
jgi:hypothetical protein